MMRFLMAKAGLVARPCRREREAWQRRETELLRALEMAVALTGSYARQLNAYDGGQRRYCENGAAWLAWLREHAPL